MAWLEITVDIHGSDMDSAAAALTAAGFADLVLEDQQTFEAFLEDNRDYWDYIDEQLQQQLQGLCRIKLYLEDSDRTGMERLQQTLDRLGFSMEVAPMAETNWEESWKENYPAVEVGNAFAVVPYWLEDSAAPGRLPVILDPGLTFGTGAHPSTQMVMEVMENLVKPGHHCLDLGSGSGILSIAALRLGAESAVGVDVDPKAEDIARENAAYNGDCAERFTAFTGNVTTDHALMEALSKRRYDFVFVNIVADVIIHLAPILPRFLDRGSILICSGILDSRLQDVRDALTAAGLRIADQRAKEDWRCITAYKEGLV